VGRGVVDTGETREILADRGFVGLHFLSTKKQEPRKAINLVPARQDPVLVFSTPADSAYLSPAGFLVPLQSGDCR
jgi:hypothetical protein